MCLLVISTQSECRTRHVTHIVVHSPHHRCHGKEINITRSECVSVAVLIRHTKRIYHIIFSSIACPAVPFCTHYLANGTIFGGKKTHHHHMSVMEFGHLLTRSGLTYLEVSSEVCHDSFCQLGNSVSLSWVVCHEAFCLQVVSKV